jgi:cytochrome c-type biogenesis protein
MGRPEDPFAVIGPAAKHPESDTVAREEVPVFEVASVNVIIAFLFGALSFLSPCVLPLLPGYLAMMSGYSVDDVAEGNVSTRRMLRVTLLFVAGFTLVFVLLGATATTIGSTLLRNSPDITTVAGWVVVAMGALIVATALWNPRLLMPFMRDRRVEVRPSRLGGWAPPVMGAAFGFAWTPCIGPTLAAILTVAGTQQTIGQGMFLLLVYSLGLGVPFVLAGLGIGRVYGSFGWFRRRFRPIAVTSGVLLAGFGVLMITGRLIELNRWFQEWLPEMFWNV